MKLTFLGTGAAYYPVLGSTSAYFVKDGCLYLIDCGETTFARIFGRKVLTDCEQVHVLISHLHADHIGSLGSFISYCKNVLHKPVTVLCPDPTLSAVLSMTGLTYDDYTFCKNLNCVFPGNITFTPILVKHDMSMCCYGYFIKDDEEVVYYGADACGIPDGILSQLRDGTLARAYQEVTYENHLSPSHTSLEQLCQLVPRHLRSKVVCMHFGGDYVQLAADYGFDVAIPE